MYVIVIIVCAYDVARICWNALCMLTRIPIALTLAVTLSRIMSRCEQLAFAEFDILAVLLVQ